MVKPGMVGGTPATIRQPIFAIALGPLRLTIGDQKTKPPSISMACVASRNPAFLTARSTTDGYWEPKSTTLSARLNETGWSRVPARACSYVLAHYANWKLAQVKGSL